MSRTRLIGLFALAKLLLHYAISPGYGYFRDEFYYLACTEHLAPGRRTFDHSSDQLQRPLFVAAATLPGRAGFPVGYVV